MMMGLIQEYDRFLKTQEGRMSISSISGAAAYLPPMAANRAAPQQAQPQTAKVDSDGDFDNSGPNDTDRRLDIKV